MKRNAIDLESIAYYDNLILAFHKAARGKHYRQDVQKFLLTFDQNIHRLSLAILTESMPYGHCRAFYIYDPKKRLIHAACFEDRIFHHAVMNIAGEVIERAMSPNSYACRPDKGVHKAGRQVQKNLQRYAYYVKIDISAYFEKVNHACLLQILNRRFKGRAFIRQLQRIIQSYESSFQCGLPIGLLTSQYFANYYLDGLDRYLEVHSKVRAYVRYMDDIIWWCDSRQTAQKTLLEIKDWLQHQRHLEVKPNIQIQASKQGVTYCGFRLTPGAIRLTRRLKSRYQQRRQYWENLYLQGIINASQLQNLYASVQAMTANTDSREWRRKNLQLHPALQV